MVSEKEQIPPAFTFGRVVLQKYLEPCANLSDLGTNSCPAERTAAVAGEVSASSRRTGRLGHLSFTLRLLPFGCEKLMMPRSGFCYAWFLPILYKSHEKSCLSLNRQSCKALIVHEVTRGGTVRCSNKLATWAAGLFVETSVGCYQRA